MIASVVGSVSASVGVSVAASVVTAVSSADDGGVSFCVHDASDSIPHKAIIKAVFLII